MLDECKCVGVQAKHTLHVYNFFCPALSERALDQHFEMCVCVCVCVCVSVTNFLASDWSKIADFAPDVVRCR